MTLFRTPLVLLFSLTLLQACSGSSGNPDDNDGSFDNQLSSISCDLGSGSNVTVSGRATYERVSLKSSGALDFDNISTMPVRGAVVQAVCNTAIATTTTDANGNYSLSIPANTQNVFIRVKAQMLKSGTPAWDVAVSSSSSTSELIYTMDGGLFNSASSNSTRNLHAPTGWNGSSYASTRTAAPFAILDTIYESMQLILSVAPSSLFPALDVKWGPDNTSGTFYSNNTISVLGRITDTDEFDEHVISHEWGHYFQDAFSRDESIGGPHSQGDVLDVRVAFSEGFGNAFSAMTTGDPVYKDSVGLTSGFNINVESNTCAFSKGWFSECSVQSIMYDLFDTANDGNDTISLGFSPIYTAMTVDMPESEALSSLFSFINPYKALPAVTPGQVDTLLNEQLIVDSINDDTGSNIASPNPGIRDQLPVYDETGAASISLCTIGEQGGYNGLGVTRFAQFTAPSSGTYTFTANMPVGLSNTDPDMYISHKGVIVGAGESTVTNSETMSVSLIGGRVYVLELLEYATYGNPDYSGTPAPNQTCFTVTRTI